MITVSRGHFELSLIPEFGGCVGAFKAFGKDVLRPAKPMIAQSWDARNSAGFPMLPFVGRISDGRFQVNGKDVTLPANMPPEPHAIHGYGWQHPWTVAHLTDASVTLQHTYSGAYWPWPYKAEQIFELSDTGLNLTLSIQNEGDTAMPTGFGWHPYFPRDSATLQAPVTQSWTGLNTAPERAALTNETDLRHTRHVEDLDLDTAFDCDNAPVIIETHQHLIRLKSDPIFSKLTVYVPKSENYFCVEPITHAPDAINMALPRDETGLIWLDPGETLQGTVSSDVSPRKANDHSA